MKKSDTRTPSYFLTPTPLVVRRGGASASFRRSAASARRGGRVAAFTTRSVATPVDVRPIVTPRPDVAMPNMEDPWSDPKWVGVKWTVYRDVAYGDL
jgi:hypothetical protein